MSHILDNPIYNSLITAHHKYSAGSENVKFYNKEIASFAGLKNNSIKDFEELYKISDANDLFIVFSKLKIEIPKSWKLITRIDMYQLVYQKNEIPEFDNISLRDLCETNVTEMTDLVNLTKPGPFRIRTIDLGNYTGIFEDDKLVSMAGHRFNPTPYTEISAVCTHPDYLGKGYAYILLCEQVKRILNKSEIPFLHVRSDNIAAVKLYQKVGFEIRTEMIAYVISKESDF
ncbi:GNAT family N-acetyltransferase [Pedobacter jamesrossensis]|uniref:GNAT family N-acetyltransferase n=1 Tax=Pedobacter jamesrossensis TaxID=1908238 RepID=A0ABV8NQL1_9SPHI